MNGSKAEVEAKSEAEAEAELAVEAEIMEVEAEAKSKSKSKSEVGAASSTETISEGETKSASLYLKPIKSHAPKEALSLTCTQGQSYPTPIIHYRRSSNCHDTRDLSEFSGIGCILG